MKNCKIYISALLMRNDEHNDKVYVANRILKSLCLKYDFTFINHFRIKDSSLFHDNNHLKRQSGFRIFLNDIRSSLFDFKPRNFQPTRRNFNGPMPFFWPNNMGPFLVRALMVIVECNSMS